MNSFDADGRESSASDVPSPGLPRLWIGYLLGGGTMAAEFVAVQLHPEMAKGGFFPPLYVFLPSFVAIVYWLACVHRYHVVMKNVAGWKHPISPARAVGFHFIPLYYLYWMFKWPQEIARFVNQRLGRLIMKPLAVGLAFMAAVLLLLFDPGFGLILLFLPLSYISAGLRHAFAAQAGLPPSPE